MADAIIPKHTSMVELKINPAVEMRKERTPEPMRTQGRIWKYVSIMPNLSM